MTTDISNRTAKKVILTDGSGAVLIPYTGIDADEINEGIETLESSISTLETSLSSLETDITDLQNRVVNYAAEVQTSAVEIMAATPYIDFHYGSSTDDYTARIIESTEGELHINATPDTTSNSTAIATTAFVRAAITAYGSSGSVGDVSSSASFTASQGSATGCYIELGDLKIVYGTATTDSGICIFTFPVTFTSRPYVTATIDDTSNSTYHGASSVSLVLTARVDNVTTTSCEIDLFKILARYDDGYEVYATRSSAGTRTVNFIAIGV